jgi:hypothetical protein
MSRLPRRTRCAAPGYLPWKYTAASMAKSCLFPSQTPGWYVHVFANRPAGHEKRQR